MVHNLDIEPKRKKYKRSASGYQGVNKDKRNGKFQARASVNGKRTTIGVFHKTKQAARTYDQAASNAGKKTRLNFPDEATIEEKNVNKSVCIKIIYEYV